MNCTTCGHTRLEHSGVEIRHFATAQRACSICDCVAFAPKTKPGAAARRAVQGPGGAVKYLVPADMLDGVRALARGMGGNPDHFEAAPAPTVRVTDEQLATMLAAREGDRLLIGGVPLTTVGIIAVLVAEVKRLRRFEQWTFDSAKAQYERLLAEFPSQCQTAPSNEAG